MIKKLIIKDAVGAWLLLTGCLFAGVVINEMRPVPLPLIYSSPEARLNQAVANLSPAPAPSSVPEGNVGLDEMRRICSEHAALILDARPGIFYQLGHIPSAVSLPRDDFEAQYQAKQALLEADRKKDLIVYCSGSDCHDSQMVADALRSLGYAHVRVFRGGWGEWDSANLPEEKE
jgi:rhodanese-related sulfurtransferase